MAFRLVVFLYLGVISVAAYAALTEDPAPVAVGEGATTTQETMRRVLQGWDPTAAHFPETGAADRGAIW